MQLGFQFGLVNLGGDVHVLGPHPDGRPWRIGIQHPRFPNKPIASIDIVKGAIATSGDYERYMVVDGKRYSHLLNPSSGKSIRPYFASISVIAEHCLIAGSFSTIAMLKSEKEKNWISDKGVPYLTVDQKMILSGTVDIAKITTNPPKQ